MQTQGRNFENQLYLKYDRKLKDFGLFTSILHPIASGDRLPNGSSDIQAQWKTTV